MFNTTLLKSFNLIKIDSGPNIEKLVEVTLQSTDTDYLKDLLILVDKIRPQSAPSMK